MPEDDSCEERAWIEGTSRGIRFRSAERKRVARDVRNQALRAAIGRLGRARAAKKNAEKEEREARLAFHDLRSVDVDAVFRLFVDPSEAGEMRLYFHKTRAKSVDNPELEFNFSLDVPDKE